VKTELLLKDGFDAAIDYTEHDTVESARLALSVAAPKGVDVYFDNTGGHITDAVFDLTNKFARVAVCGQIAVYNMSDPSNPPVAKAFLHKLIYKSVTIRGFVVRDFYTKPNALDTFFREVGQGIKENKIKYHETTFEGLRSYQRLSLVYSLVQIPERLLSKYNFTIITTSIISVVSLFSLLFLSCVLWIHCHQFRRLRLCGTVSFVPTAT